MNFYANNQIKMQKYARFCNFEQFRRYLGLANRFLFEGNCYFCTVNCWWNEVFFVTLQTE
jgi:hypothetical protein